jgi:hypothetical protein
VALLSRETGLSGMLAKELADARAHACDAGDSVAAALGPQAR